MQIPDVRTGDNIIDAVVVDEEAVGLEGRGSGAKILYGKDALDRYLSQHKLTDQVNFHSVMSYLSSNYCCTCLDFQ